MVDLVRSSKDRTLTDIARSLGIHLETLREWVHDDKVRVRAADGGGDADMTPDEKEELKPAAGEHPTEGGQRDPPGSRPGPLEDVDVLAQAAVFPPRRGQFLAFAAGQAVALARIDRSLPDPVAHRGLGTRPSSWRSRDCCPGQAEAQGARQTPLRPWATPRVHLARSRRRPRQTGRQQRRSPPRPLLPGLASAVASRRSRTAWSRWLGAAAVEAQQLLLCRSFCGGRSMAGS
ncbi:hypothetical protein [Streptomyces sp. NBC_01190]|uniref:hypothetical protein n=1 Tax=Streptomyces sp. NBC_01190 TaxID=2903767 RepID=UPI0038666F8F